MQNLIVKEGRGLFLGGYGMYKSISQTVPRPVQVWLYQELSPYPPQFDKFLEISPLRHSIKLGLRINYTYAGMCLKYTKVTSSKGNEEIFSELTCLITNLNFIRQSVIVILIDTN